MGFYCNKNEGVLFSDEILTILVQKLEKEILMEIEEDEWE